MAHDGPPATHDQSARLAALVGSRICHDLISPVGAIGNGIELLSLTGTTSGPEMGMMADSVGNAQARIRFFRIAFGVADRAQSLSAQELREVITALYTGGRLDVSFDLSGDVRYDEAKLAFLGVHCMESAMPHGGGIAISRHSGAWTLSATAPKIRDLGAYWSLASGDDDGQMQVTPDKVQFPLLGHQARAMGREVAIDQSGDRLLLTL